MKINPLILMASLWLGSLPSFAQVEDLNPKDYPFLALDKNKLRFYGDTTHFNTVFEKLDSMVFLGSGQLSILHIGGSHVQGGTLQRTMRSKFDNLMPDIGGERGFFFPYKMAHSNMPFDYHVTYSGAWTGCRNAKKNRSCTWGMSGYNATTTDSTAHTKLYMSDLQEQNYRFNKVRIFYQMDADSYATKLDSLYGSVTSTIDSLGQFIEYSFATTFDTLAFSLIKTDSLQTHFTLRGIQYITNEPGITYHSIGVNGASVPAYLRSFDFGKEIKFLSPDLVIFGIGINDANGPTNRFSQTSFENHYRDLINWFKAANPQVNFVFLTNNDSYYRRRYPNQNVFKVVKAMQKLAKENNGAVWNLFEIMGGIGSVKLWEKTGLAKADKVHFTSAGYQLQSDLFFEAFQRAYGNYIRQTTKPPSID
ncbi:MAG: GDSL-type esterase/lipase family protein [Cyclobacteriaceae bacterium]|nr:GDSL-type esterase/lipase family protein [Cyclobacteriaceae bacterium]